MSEFFEQLRGDARLEGRGEFTLDLEQAQRKMSRFQLRRPSDFLYHLVAGLFYLGATRLAVDEQAGRLSLELPALALPTGLLENLSGWLFEEDCGRRRLAGAAQSVLNFDLVRFDWLGARGDQHFDYLSGQGRNWSNVSLSGVVLEGLPPAVLEEALRELCERGAWSRRPLRVGARHFQMVPGLSVRLGGLDGECEWRPGEKSELLLVMDEMVADRRAVSAPFAWTGVCYGSFRLDASLAQVVEDEGVERILADVPGTYVNCVRQGLARVAPEILLPLLTPLPLWLEPLRGRLLATPLFEDQHRRPWSLAELLAREEPVYVAENAREVQGLEVSLLVGASTVGLSCLEMYLGSRLQRVDLVVLRQLQRDQNYRTWLEQTEQPLQLPARHWLYQQDFVRGGNRWLVGIPDDWSRPGVQVGCWLRGRKLCESRLILQDFTCEIVCEVEEIQVNELWTGLDTAAWNLLEAAWNESIGQVLEGFAGGREGQSEVRRYLKEHLAATLRPRDNYFRRTLLWEDWHGHLHSLDQLLELDAVGVVGADLRAEDYPADLIPDGIFLRDSGVEVALLEKVGPVVLLDPLLEDLSLAQSQAFTENSLEPVPEFGVATVAFCRAGVCLEPIRIGSERAFHAWVCVDDLGVEIVPGNQPRGLERFRPADDERTHRALDALEQQVEAALARIFQDQPSEVWLDWLRQATLRGLCRGFLEQVACWPALQGRVSWQQLLEAEVVEWCSGEAVPGFESPLLLTGLAHGNQAELALLLPETRWVCRDEVFAREQEQIDFLRQPLWRPVFPSLLGEQKPDLWLVPLGAGRVYWLFQGRLVEEQVGGVPYGFRLAVECPTLRTEDRPAEVEERCWAFLQEWLATPRQPLWEHWQQWNKEGMPAAVLQRLQSRPWFVTNRGSFSWRQLMEAPELWLFEGAELPSNAEELLVVQGTYGLLEGHPGLRGPRETELRLAEIRERESQRLHAAEHGLRLRGLRHRVAFEGGELALSGDARKGVWLLQGEGQTLIDNLPAGLAGFVHAEGSLRVLRNETMARIDDELRSRLLQRAAELVQARVAAGPLTRAELDLVCEVCLGVDLERLRWIECADGSYASLEGLRQEAERRGELLYWPRNYLLKAGGAALLPILSSPLMLEVVGRVARLQLCPPPLLYREVGLPGGFGRALSSLARVCEGKGGLLGGIRNLLGRGPVAEDAQGRALLDSLRRRAAQLLRGVAQSECLRLLEDARLRAGKGRLWEFQERLWLRSDHPLLAGWLGDQEPPLAVQTSLLLSLVCASNAVSEPFTDEMEREFLEEFSQELLASLPRCCSM